MSDRSMQVKVGALIVVATVILVGFMFLLGSFSVGPKRNYFLEFSDSGAMLRGAPVKIAGVRAGRVESVEFLVERGAQKSAPVEGAAPVNVRVTISVDEKMASAVRQDSEFFITTQGVLGEKYMEIIPGSQGAPEWPDGAYVRGADPARMDLIFTRVDRILGSVEEALGGGDLDIKAFIDTLKRLVERINDFLERNEGRLDSIAEQVEAATGDAADLVRYLKEGVGGPEPIGDIVTNVRKVSRVAARQIDPTLGEARSAMRKADETLTRVNEIVARNEQSIDAAMANLEPTTADARKVMQDVAYITDGLSQGRGTVGQMIFDQEIYDDLKEMLRDLKRHPWKVLWRE